MTRHARDNHLVRPLTAHLTGAEVIGGSAWSELGQLAGRADMRFTGSNDGSPDRVLAQWTVRAAAGTQVQIAVAHPRAGSTSASAMLA